MLGKFLSKAGHTPLMAESGPEALAIIRERKPDLVLLDIGMPEMDGFEVLEAMPRDPANGPDPGHHAHRLQRRRQASPRPGTGSQRLLRQGHVRPGPAAGAHRAACRLAASGHHWDARYCGTTVAAAHGMSEQLAVTVERERHATQAPASDAERAFLELSRCEDTYFLSEAG